MDAITFILLSLAYFIVGFCANSFVYLKWFNHSKGPTTVGDVAHFALFGNENDDAGDISAILLWPFWLFMSLIFVVCGRIMKIRIDNGREDGEE